MQDHNIRIMEELVVTTEELVIFTELVIMEVDRVVNKELYIFTLTI